MATSAAPDNSTTAFVAGALDRIKHAQTEQQRREAYRAIYFRVAERLNVLARKSSLKPVVPEAFTQDIADGADERLEKFFAKEENEKHWKKMKGINDLLNIAARHMRFFLMDVIRKRSQGGALTDQAVPDDHGLDDWLNSRMLNDPRRTQPATPDQIAANNETRMNVLARFWEAFDLMDQENPKLTELLEKSVVLGMSNVDLAELEGVSESTIREWIKKARIMFLRFFGDEWPFDN